ncbi:UDP-N-acetylmuramoyl-L-alanine--D-glutamate ligase [Synechococcus elongatus]|uniref:UDP-N-acetylmuramoyl-L-alanine--D-glutamate ligase n=1 Tax=Synechococcus elongatus TaxID=32046 RepID=UPI0030CFA7B1
MQRAHVIGLGKSGCAAALLLRQQGWQVELSDRNHQATAPQTLVEAGVQLRLGQSLDPIALGWEQPEQRPDYLIVSPGVPWDLPGLDQSRSLGISTLGELELAWRSLSTVPWVAVTGTNGKTTTTALIAAIFTQAGLNAPACGNIGLAACEVALQQQSPEAKPLDWVVAEASSYQIEAAATLAATIGVWTTFTPDHLNRHYTLENYFAIKASLLDRAQQQVLNGDDPYLRERANATSRWPGAFWTSTQGAAALPTGRDRGFWIEDGWVIDRGDRLFPVERFSMVGNHNQQNLLMAVAAARLAGIEAPAIAEAMAEFPGIPHRLERVATWQGIDLINDSKATNYDAAWVGLQAVPGRTILIAGGEAKQGDDQAWLALIQAKASAVLLIGSAAPLFARRLAEVGYTGLVADVETLDRAVPRAVELAQSLGAQQVLLSPACASFDQYPNFEARGDHFRRCAQAITQG